MAGASINATPLTSCQYCVSIECTDTNLTIDVDVTREILNNSVTDSVRISSAHPPSSTHA